MIYHTSGKNVNDNKINPITVKPLPSNSGASDHVEIKSFHLHESLTTLLLNTLMKYNPFAKN